MKISEGVTDQDWAIISYIIKLKLCILTIYVLCIYTINLIEVNYIIYVFRYKMMINLCIHQINSNN